MVDTLALACLAARKVKQGPLNGLPEGCVLVVEWSVYRDRTGALEVSVRAVITLTH